MRNSRLECDKSLKSSSICPWGKMPSLEYGTHVILYLMRLKFLFEFC